MPGRREIDRRRLLIAGGSAAAAAGLGLAGCTPAPDDEVPKSAVEAGALHEGPGPGGEAGGPPPKLRVLKTTMLNRIVGPENTGKNWYVYGADLGHMFMHKGKIHIVFGDTFGPSTGYPFLSVPPNDWRSSSLGTIAPVDRPRSGLTIDGFVTDRPGHAMQLYPSKKDFKTETTVIPTYGISLGDRMVMHYMSVRQFFSGKEWTLNYSGFAYSDDDGQNWVQDPDATWPHDSKFGQVGMVGIDPWVYLFGVPGGRLGSVSLARVRADDILDVHAYQFWDGTGWRSKAEAATTVVQGPVGELAVQWNSHYQAWLMTHQNVVTEQLMLRTARHLTGPWSDPVEIANAKRWSTCYAPFITPLWNDGPEIYYTMTRYAPYTVYTMHTSLMPRPD